MFGWFRRKPDVAAGIATGLAEIRAYDALTRYRVQKGVVLANKRVDARFPTAELWMSSTWEQKEQVFDELAALEDEWQTNDAAVSRGVWLVVVALSVIPMGPDLNEKVGKLMDELLLNQIEVLGTIASTANPDGE
jgi:hypothetical protein